MPRREKYEPERVRRILEAIQLGATYRLASLYGGISEDTLSEWKRRHPDFAARVKEAEGRAALGWLAKIEKSASDGEWTAAAWKLERRYPQEYGRQQTIEHTGDVTVRRFIGVDVDNV